MSVRGQLVGLALVLSCASLRTSRPATEHLAQERTWRVSKLQEEQEKAGFAQHVNTVLLVSRFVLQVDDR